MNRFGTLVTNIHESYLAPYQVKKVEVGIFAVGGLSQAYSDVALGSPLALYGSSGYLEIAYNGDSAEKRLDMGIGIIVKVQVETGTN